MDGRWRIVPSPAWALLALRIVVGIGFIAHGAAKWSRGPEKFGHLLAFIGVPAPGASAWMVTLVEVFGGLALLAGAFVLVASIPLISTMLVALFTLQLRYGFSAVNTTGLTAAGPTFGPPGYEINLLYIAALVVLVAAGPGALAIDGWRMRRRIGRIAR